MAKKTKQKNRAEAQKHTIKTEGYSSDAFYSFFDDFTPLSVLLFRWTDFMFRVIP